MQQHGTKQRVIVYIDGYNLYYGQREEYGDSYNWLDLQALATSFLKPDMELISVKYFTATRGGETGSKRRQQIYLKALQEHCDKLEIFNGRFLSKSSSCSNCGFNQKTFEEKKTDVSIACQIINDAYLDHYDCCYVVSGDSDLVPALEIIKIHHPNKRSLIAYPPCRRNNELCKIAGGWFALDQGKLRKQFTARANHL